MSILIPFKTGEPVEFKEPQVDGALKAVICGRADVTEYDTSLYATEDDLKNAVRSNIIPIAKDSFENWPSESIMRSQTEALLNSFLEEGFRKMGITASVEVTSFKLTDESQEIYNASEAADILAPYKKNQPTLDDLTPETHGPVVSIITSYSSHGMAMNSGSSGSETVVWQDDGSMQIERTNSNYEKETIEKYIAGSEAAAKLRAYVSESRIAEMAQIKSIPFPFTMTDYSSSSYMTFTFDDSAVSGEKNVTRRIDRSSFWQVQSKVIRKIDELINECIKTGECIENTTKETGNTNPVTTMGFMGLGMMGVNEPAPSAPSAAPSAPSAPSSSSGNSWKCSCGTENYGKFCANCGSPKPAGKWKCPSCGTENEGKFCAECATPRP